MTRATAVIALTLLAGLTVRPHAQAPSNRFEVARLVIESAARPTPD